MTHNRQYNGKMKKAKDKQWPITDNTMDIWTRQRKTMTHNRQYNDQMKNTKDKHWPITDNTMVKWKRQRTNNDP
jgi:hypothetical protein